MKPQWIWVALGFSSLLFGLASTRKEEDEDGDKLEKRNESELRIVNLSFSEEKMTFLNGGINIEGNK